MFSHDFHVFIFYENEFRSLPFSSFSHASHSHFVSQTVYPLQHFVACPLWSDEPHDIQRQRHQMTTSGITSFTFSFSIFQSNLIFVFTASNWNTPLSHLLWSAKNVVNKIYRFVVVKWKFVHYVPTVFSFLLPIHIPKILLSLLSFFIPFLCHLRYIRMLSLGPQTKASIPARCTWRTRLAASQGNDSECCELFGFCKCKFNK